MRDQPVLTWVLRLTLTAGALTGVIGALHLPAGRAALRALTGGCPVGADLTLSPEGRDEARTTALRRVQGNAPAPSRPALGFVLEQSSRVDVAAWSTTHGLGCQPDGLAVRCDDVPASAWGGPVAADQVLLTFDAHDRLIAASVSVSALAPDDAAAALRTLTDDLTRRAGPATSTRGEPDGAFLAAGEMRQAASEFRFADYRAQVTATHIALGRVSLRSVFQAIPQT